MTSGCSCWNSPQARISDWRVAAAGYGFVSLLCSLQRFLAEDDGDSVD